jgi:hypothetical protein
MKRDAIARKLGGENVRQPFREGIVTELHEDGRIGVRLADQLPSQLVARVAVLGYAPSLGDRVLVAPGDACFVVGVVKASQGVRLSTKNGASASLEGDTITILDAVGRALVTFDSATGSAEILAPGGDLRLSAPAGRVIVDAAMDLELSAQRDVTIRGDRRIAVGLSVDRDESDPDRLAPGAAVAVGGRTLDIEASALGITSERAQLKLGEASLAAERLESTAAHQVLTAGRIEVRAERWIERLKDVYSDVDGLLQTRAGRVRTLVHDAYQLVSRRTSLASQEETSIDGKRVLLG